MRVAPVHRSGGAVRVWRRTLAASVSVVASVMLSFSVDDDAMLLRLADRSPAAESFVTRSLLTHRVRADHPRVLRLR